MVSPVVSVGVDNGGTWIRLVGLNARGRRVWSLKKPSPPVETLPAFLKEHLRRFSGRLDALAVGSRGVWKQTKRRAVKRALRGLAKKIVVMSDVEAAWMAAFGNIRVEGRATRDEKGKNISKNLVPHPSSHTSGIIVISGTGSIAYGRRADGMSARAGGLGPEKGDEGSGYWIGKEWLERRGRRDETRGRRDKRRTYVRRTAQLAPTVIRKARRGNSMALNIIREAQFHLGNLVFEIIKLLRWKSRIPLSVSGSVLASEWFKRGFLHQVQKRRVVFKFVPLQKDVAYALASSLIARPSSLNEV